MHTPAVGRDSVKNALLLTLAVFGLNLPWCSTARAQVARVAALQHIAERLAGGGWQRVGVGAGLNAGNSFRTGKRSKADIRFGDGSLLRLGQLSAIQIQDHQHVALRGGQLLFAMLHPGTHIQAGAAAAEIKGSVGIITLNDDGSSEFTLYSGAMDVVAGNRTISVPPGFTVVSNSVGILSALRFAVPFGFAGSVGGQVSKHGGGDLTEGPVDSPYVGSQTNVLVRTTPERINLDQNIDTSISNSNPQIVSANPLSGGTSQGKISFPTPFPTSTPPVPVTFPTVTPPAQTSVRAGTEAYQGQAAAPAAGASTVVPGAAAPGGLPPAETETVVTDLNESAALRHIEGAERNKGSASGVDMALVAAIASGGTDAYGALLHAFAARGQWVFDIAAQPLEIRFHTPLGTTTRDASAISSGFIAYRDERGQVQIGRQRFAQGPTQATLFGSLVRQGGREIMDAARIQPELGRGQRLELAYIYDAYVNNLPYVVPGHQAGWYGRYAAQKRFGNFGVNLLGYSNASVPTTTGITGDFALPVVRDKVELYGEFGRDTFRRNLSTVGVTLPFLHDRFDYDVYLEYANLRASSVAPRAPTELALRVYRSIGRNLNMVGQVSRFYGVNTMFTLGLSYGFSTSRHN